MCIHIMNYEFNKVATYRHMYRAEPKEPTQFGSVSGSEIQHLPFSHSGILSFIGQNQKNQPNLVLYLVRSVRRSKISVSVATLEFTMTRDVQIEGNHPPSTPLPRTTNSKSRTLKNIALEKRACRSLENCVSLADWHRSHQRVRLPEKISCMSAQHQKS